MYYFCKVRYPHSSYLSDSHICRNPIYPRYFRVPDMHNKPQKVVRSAVRSLLFSALLRDASQQR